MPYAQWEAVAAAGGPTLVTRAEGVRVWDSDGRCYLDGISALEAAVVGHGRLEIVDAVEQQLRQVSFLDVFRYAAASQVELAARLAALSPGDLTRVMFSPGGSEADEVAIKMARQFHVLNGEPGRHKVIGRWGAYHGCTLGMMAVDGNYFLSVAKLKSPVVAR